MEQKNTKKWYVVKAISGKEKKAKEYIETEIAKRGWSNYVSQVVVPTEKYVSIKNGKRVVKERNYFPGYVMLEVELFDDIVPVIQNVPSVIDWLRDAGNGVPVPMLEGEANRILGKMDEQAETEGELEDVYEVGEMVKVIDGPFSSFSGMIEEVNTEKKKLKLTVRIFGRRTPLELNFNQVERDKEATK
ncbi:MAG: transcription termination/antitermination protein NusG [Bacteroidales bacterium]|nr:transcription termination/antitermination protein NusG [Bacteroidales bacterium]